MRDHNELALPLGASKTSPISAVDVAHAVSVILDDPAPHIGKIYSLTDLNRPISIIMRAPSLKHLAGQSAIVMCR